MSNSILKPRKPRQPLQSVDMGQNEEEEDTTEVRRRRVSFAGVNKIKEFDSAAESVVICETPAYEEEFTASSDSSQILKDLNSPCNIIKTLNNHEKTDLESSDMNISCVDYQCSQSYSSSHMIMTNIHQQELMNDSMELTGNVCLKKSQDSFMQKTPVIPSNVIFNSSCGNALINQSLPLEKSIGNKENMLNPILANSESKNYQSYMSVIQPTCSDQPSYSALYNSSVLAKTLSSQSPAHKRYRLSDLPDNGGDDMDISHNISSLQKQLSYNQNTSCVSLTMAGLHPLTPSGSAITLNRSETVNPSLDILSKNNSMNTTCGSANISMTCAFDQDLPGINQNAVYSEQKLNADYSSDTESSGESVNLSALMKKVQTKCIVAPPNLSLFHLSSVHPLAQSMNNDSQENSRSEKRKLDDMKMEETGIINSNTRVENCFSAGDFYTKFQSQNQIPGKDDLGDSFGSGATFDCNNETNKSDSHMEMANLSHEPFVEVVQIPEHIDDTNKSIGNTSDLKNKLQYSLVQDYRRSNLTVSPERVHPFIYDNSFKQERDEVSMNETCQMTLAENECPGVLNDSGADLPYSIPLSNSSVAPVLKDNLVEIELKPEKADNPSFYDDNLIKLNKKSLYSFAPLPEYSETSNMVSMQQSNCPNLDDNVKTLLKNMVWNSTAPEDEFVSNTPDQVPGRLSTLSVDKTDLQLEEGIYSRQSANNDLDDLNKPRCILSKMSTVPTSEIKFPEENTVLTDQKNTMPEYESDQQEKDLSLLPDFPILQENLNNISESDRTTEDGVTFENPLRQLTFDKGLLKPSRKSVFEDDLEIPVRMSKTSIEPFIEDNIKSNRSLAKKSTVPITDKVVSVRLSTAEEELEKPDRRSMTQLMPSMVEDESGKPNRMSMRQSMVEEESENPNRMSIRQSMAPIVGEESERPDRRSIRQSMAPLVEEESENPGKKSMRQSIIPMVEEEFEKPNRMSVRQSMAPMLEEETEEPVRSSMRQSMAPMVEEESEKPNRMSMRQSMAPMLEETEEPVRRSMRQSMAPMVEETEEPVRRSMRQSMAPMVEEESEEPVRRSMRQSMAPMVEEESEKPYRTSMRPSMAPMLEETEEPVRRSMRQSMAPMVEETEEPVRRSMRQSMAPMVEEESEEPVRRSMRQSMAPMVEEESEKPNRMSMRPSMAPMLEETEEPVRRSMRHSMTPIVEEESKKFNRMSMRQSTTSGMFDEPKKLSKESIKDPISPLRDCDSYKHKETMGESIVSGAEDEFEMPNNVSNEHSIALLEEKDLFNCSEMPTNASPAHVVDESLVEPSQVSTKQSVSLKADDIELAEMEQSVLSDECLEPYNEVRIASAPLEAEPIENSFSISTSLIAEDNVIKPQRVSLMKSSTPLHQVKSAELSSVATRQSIAPISEDNFKETDRKPLKKSVSPLSNTDNINLNLYDHCDSIMTGCDLKMQEDNFKKADDINASTLSSSFSSENNEVRANCCSITPEMINSSIPVSHSFPMSSDNKILNSVMIKVNEMFIKEPVEICDKKIEMICKIIDDGNVFESEMECDEEIDDPPQSEVLSDVRDPGKAFSPLQWHNSYSGIRKKVHEKKNTPEKSTRNKSSYKVLTPYQVFMEEMELYYSEWTEWTTDFFSNSIILTVKVPWVQFDMKTPVENISIKSVDFDAITEQGLNFCSGVVVSRLLKNKSLDKCKCLGDVDKLFSAVEKQIKSISPLYRQLRACIPRTCTNIRDHSLIFKVAKLKPQMKAFNVHLSLKDLDKITSNALSLELYHGDVSLSLIRDLFRYSPADENIFYNFALMLKRI